jgi:hypothetical protein
MHTKMLGVRPLIERNDKTRPRVTPALKQCSPSSRGRYLIEEHLEDIARNFAARAGARLFRVLLLGGQHTRVQGRAFVLSARSLVEKVTLERDFS